MGDLSNSEIEPEEKVEDDKFEFNPAPDMSPLKKDLDI